MKRVFGILGIAAITVLVVVGGTLGIHGGEKQLIIAKTDWSDKEGVSHTLMGHGGMQDSCVRANPFGLPALRPAVC